MAADPPFPIQVLTKQLAKLEQEVLEAQEADKANKAQLLLLMAALGKIVANQQRLTSFEHLAEEAVKDFALYPSQNTPLVVAASCRRRPHPGRPRRCHRRCARNTRRPFRTPSRRSWAGCPACR